MPLVRDMGVTYGIEPDIGGTYDYPALLPAMRKYTERALALDPNDAEANFMMAVVYSQEGDAEQGERYMNLARQFGPNNADIMMLSAWAYSGSQTDRAIELVERTLKAQSALSRLGGTSHHLHLFCARVGSTKPMRP